MGEQKYVAEVGMCTIDHGPSPGSNLLDSFATWYSVAPQRPPRSFVSNSESSIPFIFPVIPLSQIRVEYRGVAIAGKTTSFDGSLERASQHKTETAAAKESADLRGMFLALVRKW
jgi:hypothetical protein